MKEWEENAWTDETEWRLKKKLAKMKDNSPGAHTAALPRVHCYDSPRTAFAPSLHYFSMLSPQQFP